MARIYLARHGETDWNRLGKLQGHTDIPLNDEGRAQARALAARLTRAGVGSVTTSDLSRASETGSIVAIALSLAPPATDEALRERAFGVFEGLSRDECAELHPEAWRAWVAQTAVPTGAESFDAAIARMTSALENVDGRAGASPALVVSHGGLMRLWLSSVMGAPLPLIANGTVYAVDRDGAGWVATRWES